MHPKGFFSTIFINFAEHFSFNSLMVLLVLYLTKKLSFNHLDAIFTINSFISLAFLIPIISGWIADKYLGYFTSIIIGICACILGLIILGYGNENIQFYALSILLLGFSLQKSNIQCLLGSLYHTKSNLRDAGFTILQICGNVGGIIGIIICSYVALYISYSISFSIAAIPYLISIIILLKNLKYLKSTKNLKIIAKSRTITFCFIAITFTSIIVISAYLIKSQSTQNIIFIAIFIASIIFLKIYFTANKETKHSLHIMLIFMVFACIYWMTNDQLSGSLLLFVKDNINLELFHLITIPTGAILSFQQASMLIFGLIISYYYKKHLHEISDFNRLNKSIAAFLIQMLGFALISFCVHSVYINQNTTIIWIIFAVILTGIAEILYMPTAMSFITKINHGKDSGFLTAFFLLFSGSLSAYFSSILIRLILNLHEHKFQEKIISVHKYFKLYLVIALICLTSAVALYSIRFLFKKK